MTPCLLPSPWHFCIVNTVKGLGQDQIQCCLNLLQSCGLFQGTFYCPRDKPDCCTLSPCLAFNKQSASYDGCHSQAIFELFQNLKADEMHHALSGDEAGGKVAAPLPAVSRFDRRGG